MSRKVCGMPDIHGGDENDGYECNSCKKKCAGEFKERLVERVGKDEDGYKIKTKVRVKNRRSSCCSAHVRINMRRLNEKGEVIIEEENESNI